MIDSTCMLGRLGEPEDIAYGAVYLGSEESSFVTGTNLVIDGGRVHQQLTERKQNYRKNIYAGAEKSCSRHFLVKISRGVP